MKQTNKMDPCRHDEGQAGDQRCCPFPWEQAWSGPVELRVEAANCHPEEGGYRRGTEERSGRVGVAPSDDMRA